VKLVAQERDNVNGKKTFLRLKCIVSADIAEYPVLIELINKGLIVIDR